MPVFSSLLVLPLDIHLLCGQTLVYTPEVQLLFSWVLDFLPEFQLSVAVLRVCYRSSSSMAVLLISSSPWVACQSSASSAAGPRAAYLSSSRWADLLSSYRLVDLQSFRHLVDIQSLSAVAADSMAVILSSTSGLATPLVVLLNPFVAVAVSRASLQSSTSEGPCPLSSS